MGFKNAFLAYPFRDEASLKGKARRRRNPSFLDVLALLIMGLGSFNTDMGKGKKQWRIVPIVFSGELHYFFHVTL